jgi:hypothetical protein
VGTVGLLEHQAGRPFFYAEVKMVPWRPVVRTPEKKIGKIEAFELRGPVLVEHWTDEGWSWMFSKELDILAGGDSPAEAEIRFFMILLQKKLACLQWVRCGVEGGIKVDERMVEKMREVI